MRSGVGTALVVAAAGLLAAGEARAAASAVTRWHVPDLSGMDLESVLLGLTALALLLTVLNLWQGRIVLSARRDVRRALALAEDRARAADAAAAEARREQRPLIQIKTLDLVPFSPGAARYEVGEDQYLKSVCGQIWNEGKGLGYLLGIRMETALASAIGVEVPASEQNMVLTGRKPLGVGEIWAPEQPLRAAWLDGRFDKHLLTLYAWGWVRYADVDGAIRRSGFAFAYVPSGSDGQPGAFEPCGPSSYWYDVEDAR